MYLLDQRKLRELGRVLEAWLREGIGFSFRLNAFKILLALAGFSDATPASFILFQDTKSKTFNYVYTPTGVTVYLWGALYKFASIIESKTSIKNEREWTPAGAAAKIYGADCTTVQLSDEASL